MTFIDHPYSLSGDESCLRDSIVQPPFDADIALDLKYSCSPSWPFPCPAEPDGGEEETRVER